MCMHVLHVCVCVYIACACTCAHVHVYVCACQYVCVCVCGVCVHACVLVCMCMCLCMLLSSMGKMQGPKMTNAHEQMPMSKCKRHELVPAVHSVAQKLFTNCIILLPLLHHCCCFHRCLYSALAACMLLQSSEWAAAEPCWMSCTCCALVAAADVLGWYIMGAPAAGQLELELD